MIFKNARSNWRDTTNCLCTVMTGLGLVWLGLAASLPAHSALPALDAIESGPGAAPPTRVSLGGRPAARLECRFRQGDIERAYWDIAVDWNMIDAAGMTLALACSDPSPVSQFSVYIRAGATWHAARIAPTRAGRWDDVVVYKTATSPEGVSSGWRHVDRIRVAAWRGSSRNTDLYLADLSLLRPTVEAVVLRCVATVPPGERRAARRYARNVYDAFAGQGVYPACIEDVDLQAAALRGRRLVILPYHPALDAGATDRLCAFASNGGKVMGFYNLPPKLGSVLGIGTGSYVRSSQVAGGVAGISFRGDAIAGLPSGFRQDSANFLEMLATGHGARRIGWWTNHSGHNTGHSALVLSDRGAWFGHVYLGRDSRNGAQALTALAAHFLPGIWRSAARGKLTALTEGISNGAPEPTLRLLKSRSRQRPAAYRAFEQAETYYRAAARLFDSGQYAACIDFAEKSRTEMSRGLLLMQTPPRRELRAVWCHRGYGIDGWSWDRSARQLAASGFNTLLVNVADGGHADYRSEWLAPSATFRARGDQVRDCLDACRPLGIGVHAWKICFNLGGDTGLERRFGAAGRLQKTASGRTRGWLCPSHAGNRILEARAAAELAASYPGLAGIHLDFIRFPGSDCCYCDECRSGFERVVGRKVARWPAEVRRAGALRERWLAYRRAVVTDVVRRVAAAVRAVRSDCHVSAAVFGNWTSARDTVGQDWATWAKAGYVDFLCPMNYHREASVFKTDVTRQLALLDGTRTRLFPGIGLSTGKLDPLQTMRQINVTRAAGTGGFTLFEYDRREALEVLPELAPAMGRPRP